MSTENVKVYDAEGMVVGRLGSKVAKAALLGDNIAIVNAEKAIITGDRRTVIESFKDRFNIRTSYNPRKGPFHERRPDKMIRKMIRGMLPWPNPRGKAAYKRIKVYMGIPDQFAEVERIVLEKSRYTSLKRKHITVGDLSHELGWRSPEVA
jgi:large subunit ribosomal protein L13